MSYETLKKYIQRIFFESGYRNFRITRLPDGLSVSGSKGTNDWTTVGIVLADYGISNTFLNSIRTELAIRSALRVI